MDGDVWAAFLGRIVVVDTNSTFVYVGKLDRVDAHFFLLVEADAHDRNDGQSTKERYVMDAKAYGVRANRKAVSVRRELVVSVSLLEDVVEY